jgi:ATP-dependent DNA helicase RecG
MHIEDQHTEFKESWNDDYMRTLAAFANSEGGTLIVGKNDKGDIIGIDNSKYLLENLPNKINQKLGIYPNVKIVDWNGLKQIEIHVSSYNAPISFKGKYYIRRGSTTQELTDKELNRFLLEKSNIPWESLTEDNATFNDIDEPTVQKFKSLAKNRVPRIENEDTKTVLRKLHLLGENGKLKRAAILLFGKDIRHHFMSAYFKIGKFQSESDFITDDEIEGNLFQQLEKVLEILRSKYIRLIVKGYKDWKRVEEFEYPENALREAVINSLIHKDYSGSHIQMKVFDNKIVLWNPGKLMDGLTLQDLKTSHQSILRNELICNAFYKADYIEAWGRGTTMIVESCKEAGLPEPEYVENSGGFRTIFFKDKSGTELHKKLSFEERQLLVLKYLKENRAISRARYMDICNISKRTAIRDLNNLESIGIVKKYGKSKNIEYRLNSKKQ